MDRQGARFNSLGVKLAALFGFVVLSLDGSRHRREWTAPVQGHVAGGDETLETGRVFVGPKILQPPGIRAANVHLVERRRDAEETPGIGGHGRTVRVVRLAAPRRASARTG
jgi:hypothetical protein